MCMKGITAYVGKITHVEKEQTLATKEMLVEMKAKLNEAEQDNFAHEFTEEQLECELEGLLGINDMYQDTIKGLEGVLKDKDAQIKGLMGTIYKLTDGNVKELQDMKSMFFSKHAELAEELVTQTKRFEEANKKFEIEIAVKDEIEAKLQQDIVDLKEELLSGY